MAQVLKIIHNEKQGTVHAYSMAAVDLAMQIVFFSTTAFSS